MHQDPPTFPFSDPGYIDANERKAVIEWLHVSKEMVSTNKDGIAIAKGAMPCHAHNYELT